MGLKLDWRGFLVAAGASVVATPFSELPAVLLQQDASIEDRQGLGLPRRGQATG